MLRPVEPLLIHHHLAKTAGSSLARVLRANFRGDQVFALDGAFMPRPARAADGATLPSGQHEHRFDTVREDLLRWWRTWYESLATEERARIRCVRSHTAHFLIPAVNDRPVRPFTLLRDPVERMVSLYHFSLARWDAYSRGEISRAAGDHLIGRTIRENGWSIADIYREVGGNGGVETRKAFAFFFNGQARDILYPYLDTTELPLTLSETELEDLRRRTEEVLSKYVVGTQDRFSQSVRLFADSFGWRRPFVPHMNVTPRPIVIDDATRSLIRAHNALDDDLHAWYSATLERRRRTGRLTEVRARAEVGALRATSRARRALRARLASRSL